MQRSSSIILLQNRSPSVDSSSDGVVAARADQHPLLDGVERCAFVIHPLSARQLWQHPALSAVKKLPRMMQGWIEKVASRLPTYRYAELIGVKSDYNGKSVSCDLMLMSATPKQLLSMDESFLYRRLLECSDQAKGLGAKIIGLGAYTKVAGDGGVYVTDQSSIPVTTGNSLSAASTLWAAEEALRLVHPHLVADSSGVLPIRAMIIGATGSIGRVTALLLSESVAELVLISRSIDKLGELRAEILSRNPNCRIKIATGVGSNLRDVDLVITATSNHGSRLLDVRDFKPGAIVCDCSRPMDFTKKDAEDRPDVLFIESGEVALPGNPRFTKKISIDRTHIYACLAETLILSLEGRYESYSYSRTLIPEKVKEISEIAHRHGARLAPLRGPLGLVTEEQIQKILSLVRVSSSAPQDSSRKKSYEAVPPSHL
jgi:predicted amino acid dehydrogenase